MKKLLLILVVLSFCSCTVQKSGVPKRDLKSYEKRQKTNIKVQKKIAYIHAFKPEKKSVFKGIFEK